MADNKFIQIVFSNPAEGKDDEFNQWVRQRPHT